MTVAVLVGAADLDRDSAAALRADLVAALRAAGATEIHEAADRADALRAVARAAHTGTRPVLVCAGDLVAHPSLLWMLATEPGGRSAVLVDPVGVPDVREERGRLVPGAPTVCFLGALHVGTRDLHRLAGTAQRLLAEDAGSAAVALRTRTAVDEFLAALLADGFTPAAVRVRLLHGERVTDAQSLAAARAAVAAVDEDRARLRLAVKERDDFFTTYAVSTWSPAVTRLAARLRLTPSGVTALSVLVALVAAGLFWHASRPAMILGAVLLYLGFVLDCVDGQLARYTRRFDPFGGWLDTMADRVKEYAAYAGLAAGAERLGLPHAWPLAIAAMALQTVRHMTDTWYGALHDTAATRPRPVSGAGGIGGRLSAASERVQADTGSVAYWLKRIVVFPIGERWALIAVLAATTNGRVTLLGVLVWAVLAAAYTLGLRSLRSRSMRVAVLDTVDTARHRDDGPLAALLGRVRLPGPLPVAALTAVLAGAVTAAGLAGLVDGRRASVAVLTVAVLTVAVLLAALPARSAHAGALDWLVPAALRATEYLFVTAVGVVCRVPAEAIFALLFALAMHHYDVTARMEKSAPDAVVPARLGWDGRVVVLGTAAVLGLATAGTVALAVVVAVGFLFTAAAGRRAARTSGRPEGDRG